MLETYAKQPTPMIFPGGDCAACVVSTALNYCGISKDVKESHEILKGESGIYKSLFRDVSDALKKFKGVKLIDYDHTFPPVIYSPWSEHACAQGFKFNPSKYFEKIKYYVDNDFIALIPVSELDTSRYAQTDHWIIIDSYRIEKTENSKNLSNPVTIKNYFRIVCSKNGIYEMEVLDFIKNKGGAVQIFIKPIS